MRVWFAYRPAESSWYFQSGRVNGTFTIANKETVSRRLLLPSAQFGIMDTRGRKDLCTARYLFG